MAEAAQQGQATPAPQEGSSGASGASDGTQGQGQQQDASEPRSFSQADLNKIAANEKREGKQAAINELLEQTGAESLDDVVSAWSEYQGIQEAVTSETDRLGSDLEKAKGQLKAEREARNNDAKHYALEGALRDAGINPERLRSAMRLADLSALEVDKERNVGGLDEVIEAVREEAPEFFSDANQRQRVNAPQTNGTGVATPGSAATQDPEKAWANQLLDMFGG